MTRALLFAATTILVVAACAPDAEWTFEDDGLVARAFRTGSTNVIAIDDGTERTLVDVGGKDALDTLAPRLERAGMPIATFARMILTHAHADHAGAAQALRARGVPVWVHTGDTTILRDGHDRPLHAIGLEAEILDAVLDHGFPECEPDVSFTDAFTLAEGRVEVIPVGGHTAGSVAVSVDGRALLTGDLVRGGYLGGAVARDEPLVHYFHDDEARAHAMLQALVDAHPETEVVVPAHGGPFTRADVDAFLATLAE